MNCKKCMYCIQVSANEHKVKCASKRVSESKNQWVDEPSYCAFYYKGDYRDYEVLEMMIQLKKNKEAK